VVVVFCAAWAVMVNAAASCRAAACS
jgi:hypothetical protein